MSKIDEKPRERDIYIWNIVGSLTNAMFSVVILMLVTRSLDEGQADIFSIAWSISQLMVIIGTFQIRTYQATDIKGKYNFQQYLVFRIITIAIMMLSSLIYVFIKGYDGYKITVVMIMCAIRAVEALADVYEGWFQQKERLDLAGKSITYKILISVVVFGATLIVTKDLLISSLMLLMCYIFAFVLYNIRYSRVVEGIKNCQGTRKVGRWLVELAVEGLPIFINAFLIMSIMNAPKMAIDAAIEKDIMSDGVQTAFNILFMPASFINLAYIVFRPMITKMAIAWNTGKPKQLVSILIKIELCLVGIGSFILIGSAILGIPLLSIFYGIDLSSYKAHLLIIIAGGCFYTFASVFDNALVAMRKHPVLIVAYVLTWIYVQIIADKMVASFGVMGASVAYTTSMLLFFVITIIIFVVCFIKLVKKKEIK